jgi:hypothetical protein
MAVNKARSFNLCTVNRRLLVLVRHLVWNGYCPITDWQWRVKEQLGEHNLPNSFIKYYADKTTGNNYSPSFIDTITVVCFAVAAFLAIYFNFIHQRIRRTHN